jgi:hypothetical protein
MTDESLSPSPAGRPPASPRAGQVSVVTSGSAGLGLAIAGAQARRWAAPEELTGAALLLTDSQSTYITGTVLPVDGGWTSH